MLFSKVWSHMLSLSQQSSNAVGLNGDIFGHDLMTLHPTGWCIYSQCMSC